MKNNKIKIESEVKIQLIKNEFIKISKKYSVLINKNRTNYKVLLFDMASTISLDEL